MAAAARVTAVEGEARDRAPAGVPRGLVPVAGFACLVVALQQTLVVPGVPAFPALLGESPAAVSWLVTATLLTGAVATPIVARLSDMVGRRRMLVLAMTFVLVGSLVAPLGGLGTIVLGRALQGVGTALVPVAMAQMRDSLPAGRVAPALALLSATLGIGGGVGVPLGGLILDTLSWQWLFWVSAGLSVAAVVLLARTVPAHRPAPSGGFDLTGAALLSVTLLALLLGVSQGGAWGWADLRTLGCGAVAVVAGLTWGGLELRHAAPLVDLRSAARRPVLFTHLASLTLGALMFANLLLTTMQLQGPPSEGGFGWSARDAGLAMLPNALAMFAVAPFTARLAGRLGARAVLVAGAAVTAAGYLLRVVATPSGATAVVWTTVVGIGVGIGYAALPMLITRHTPGHEIGAANGLNALLRAIGTAVASAGVAAVAAALAVEHGGEAVTSAAALTTVSVCGVAVGLLTLGFAVLVRTDRPTDQQEDPA